jgi:ribose transport system ATP-binding protein
MPARLALAGLVKQYGSTRALDGAALEVSPGSVHALVGENGAGKSTLVGMVAGGVTPDAGEMRLDEVPYRPVDPRDARAQGVVLVHQELSLFPHLSVWENILVGVESQRRGLLWHAENHRRATEALTLLGHAGLDPATRVDRLSPAMQQVVEICRAVAIRARVILLDEPTSSLQRIDVERLFAVVRKLAATGVSVVYISHALEEIREIAADITVMRDGRRVLTGAISGIDDEAIVRAMTGRDLTHRYPQRPPHDRTGAALSEPEGRVEGRVEGPAHVALSVRGLSVPPKVRDASFEVGAGEIFGIAGLIGSGRSTLVRALFGLRACHADAVHVDGAAVRAATVPTERIRAGFGYVSEDRRHEGLLVERSLVENVTLSDVHQSATRGWINAATEHRVAVSHLDAVGTKYADGRAPVRTLSGGNQQKIALARLLHQQARILLLDEPTRGIDVASKAQIYELIAQRASEGCAVVFVSSYLPELLGLCDRIAVMRRGRLEPARPASAFTEASLLEAAMGASTSAPSEVS